MMDRRFFAKFCLGAAATTLFAEDLSRAQKKDVEVFLTVDDGWYYKDEILAIANRYNVPLNLFIIGQIIEKEPKVWAKAIERGHLLGSHTYNHHKLSRISEGVAVKDFKQYKKSVTNSLGTENYEKIKFFRYPYGDKGNKHTSVATKKILADSGWQESWWNMDLSFASSKYGVSAFKDPHEQLTFFSKNIKSINVPLFHFKNPDVKTLELIIEHGVANGYKFSRLDNKKAFCGV